ncbi:MAG: hypothetical protein M0P71_07450 [Melioribacteraceae bacterium]|jgi:hypothetical protein|nr:hypothetical protein [Melioribacteraceae bacterium]MDD3982811.1 hypothetical protein [Candidatus Omnitrophota bacterium]
MTKETYLKTIEEIEKIGPCSEWKKKWQFMSYSLAEKYLQSFLNVYKFLEDSILVTSIEEHLCNCFDPDEGNKKIIIITRNNIFIYLELCEKKYEILYLPISDFKYSSVLYYTKEEKDRWNISFYFGNMSIDITTDSNKLQDAQYILACLNNAGIALRLEESLYRGIKK